MPRRVFHFSVIQRRSVGEGVPALHRQHVAGGRGQAVLEHLGHAGARFGVGELGIGGIDIGGELGFLQQPLAGILVGGVDGVAAEAEIGGDSSAGTSRRSRRSAPVSCFLGDERPGRARPACRRGARTARRSSAAGSRPDTICPGRRWMKPPGAKRSRRRRISASALARLVGPTASVFHSPLSKSSIETKVGSPPMVRRTSFCSQHVVDLVAELVEPLPAFVREGLGDARVLGDARHLHVEGEVGVDLAGRGEGAADRRGVAIMRRRGERDVALAGQQARGRVEADPAGAGQIDFAPGVEVGEIDGRCRAGRRARRGRASSWIR